MDGIVEYVVRIATLSIIFSVLEILLPSGAMRKFGALVIGVVLIYSAVVPVIGLLNGGEVDVLLLSQ